ncbi:Hva22-like protein [Thalictrum thalictroides]|uniref:HVA22-like protein n=1 Tax=Thalictrum thalictroides TaxID=46969 RepID=A0A7J6WF07_THATH|nr:Hva22-like protein [Thalictrum thalictroides]
MLGDFITRFLIMILGYAYPAFECYKTVEKNKVEIEQLRFWCQYWIIIATLTVAERFGDIFVSWLPMYGEMKLAFIIYLWSSKTKGTSYVYETFLRPYIAMYETDIDRNLMEFKAGAWDWATFTWQYCVANGQATFNRTLQYLAAQSTRRKENRAQKGNYQHPSNRQPDRQKTQQQQQSDKSRRPSSIKLMVSQVQKTELVQEHLPTVDLDHTEDHPTVAPKSDIAESIRAARIRLKRSSPPHN